jgi:hypothetical protein
MALTGNEVLYVQGITPAGSVSPVDYPTTTAAIADLVGAGGTIDIVNTAITTVGNGVLTSAGLVGGLITRTGPVAAYTDTTDAAAAIVAATSGFTLGATIFMRIKNATAFLQTLAAGTGVTLPTTNIIGPFQEGWFYAVVGGTAAAPTIALNHLFTAPIGMASGVNQPAIGANIAVGNAILSAANMVGGIIVRSGAQANTAFTDTTATASAMTSASPGLIGKIGASFLFWYQNTTNANATLTGGVGVTVSGITVVPSGTSALYVITLTATNTMTMVGIAQTAPSTASGTFVANGATAVVVADTRVTANSVIAFGLKTVGGTPAGQPFLSAVTAGTGFSVKAVAGDTSTYNYTITG